jgi:hypothetical protein
MTDRPRRPLPLPRAFIQWKGTDVCMDFHCECGQHYHIDAEFAYAVKCVKCDAVWEMPSILFPRRVEASRSPVIKTEVDADGDGWGLRK